MLKSIGATRQRVYFLNSKKNVSCYTSTTTSSSYTSGSIENIKNYFLYSLLAIPPNWILMYVLYAQIPYFINNYPGSISLATYLNMAIQCGVFTVIPYEVYCRVYLKGKQPSFEYIIPLFITLSTIVYGITIGIYYVEKPYLLYFSGFLAGSIGSLSGIIYSPFLMLLEHEYITASNVGPSVVMVLIAAIGFIQNPGSVHPTFSTTWYLVIFFILFFPALPIYWYVSKYEIGYKKKYNSIDKNNQDNNNSIKNKDNNEVMLQLDLNISIDINKDTNNKSIENAEESIKDSESISPSFTTKEVVLTPESSCYTYYRKLMYAIFPQETHPWIAEAFPYVFYVGWIEFNTYGMVGSTLAYAIQYTSTDRTNISVMIGVTIYISYFMGLIGNIATHFIRIPLVVCFIVSVFALIFYFVTFSNVQAFHNDTCGVLIIVCIEIIYFLESYIWTQSLREVADNYLEEHSEVISHWIGISQTVSTFVGAVISTLIVTYVLTY